MPRVALASASLLLLVVLRSALAAQATTARVVLGGRLEGTVTDSIRAVPYAGATLRATRNGAEPEVTLTAVTDKRGT